MNPPHGPWPESWMLWRTSLEVVKIHENPTFILVLPVKIVIFNFRVSLPEAYVYDWYMVDCVVEDACVTWTCPVSMPGMGDAPYLALCDPSRILMNKKKCSGHAHEIQGPNPRPPHNAKINSLPYLLRGLSCRSTKDSMWVASRFHATQRSALVAGCNGIQAAHFWWFCRAKKCVNDDHFAKEANEKVKDQSI